MPRFTCESCATSLYSAARAANLTDPSCPTCGASFQAQPEVERWDDEGGGLGSIGAAVTETTRLELQL
jgi:hypothetical protein